MKLPFFKNQPKCECSHSWTKHKIHEIDQFNVIIKRGRCIVKNCECEMFKG